MTSRTDQSGSEDDDCEHGQVINIVAQESIASALEKAGFKRLTRKGTKNENPEIDLRIKTRDGHEIYVKIVPWVDSPIGFQLMIQRLGQPSARSCIFGILRPNPKMPVETVEDVEQWISSILEKTGIYKLGRYTDSGSMGNYYDIKKI